LCQDLLTSTSLSHTSRLEGRNILVEHCSLHGHCFNLELMDRSDVGSILDALVFQTFFAVLLSPVLDGFDQLIRLYCTVLAVN